MDSPSHRESSTKLDLRPSLLVKAVSFPALAASIQRVKLVDPFQEVEGGFDSPPLILAGGSEP
jgi:hypothetical protein